MALENDVQALTQSVSRLVDKLDRGGGFNGGGGSSAGPGATSGGGSGGGTGGSMAGIPFGDVPNIKSAGEKIGDIIGDIFNGRIKDAFSKIGKEINPFEDFYNYFDLFKKQEADISRIFGGVEGWSKTITQTISEAIPPARALGFTEQQILSLQKESINTLKTQSLLTSDQYYKLLSSAALVSDSVESASYNANKMMPTFLSAGYSLNNISKEMEGIINTSRSLGVATQATYQQISENLNRINLINFENGVQGLAKMAANASILRIDMRNTLDMADALFKPEKAVEMASGFQRLGVQISSLLDPYKLMDMARNDPEQLQESLTEALKQYAIFNEKTQRFEIMKGAQGFIRELSEVTGVSSKQLAEWALSATELAKKMDSIRFSPEIATEDDRKLIASMAQLGERGGKFEGKYFVNFTDEQGKSQQKLVSDLREKDLEFLKGINEPKTLIELQKEANGYLKNLQYLRSARAGVISQVIAADPNVDKAFRSITKYVSELNESMNAIKGLLKNQETGLPEIGKMKGSIGDITSNFEKDLTNAYKKAADSKEGVGAFFDVGKGFYELIGKIGDLIENQAKAAHDQSTRGTQNTQSTAPSLKPNTIPPVPIPDLQQQNVSPSTSSIESPLRNYNPTNVSPAQESEEKNYSIGANINVKFESSNMDPYLNTWLKEKGLQMIEKQLIDNGILKGVG